MDCSTWCAPLCICHLNVCVSCCVLHYEHDSTHVWNWLDYTHLPTTILSVHFTNDSFSEEYSVCVQIKQYKIWHIHVHVGSLYVSLCRINIDVKNSVTFLYYIIGLCPSHSWTRGRYKVQVVFLLPWTWACWLFLSRRKPRLVGLGVCSFEYPISTWHSRFCKSFIWWGPGRAGGRWVKWIGFLQWCRVYIHSMHIYCTVYEH